jgi:uncharacterized protein with NRDE domain
MRAMCLIGLAHRVSSRFPLVIAANRDEDYERPTIEAHRWEENPEVIGGRDGLQGGSWLAVRRAGRFAAVTNLRGAMRKWKSRGALVRGFVTSDRTPESFAEEVVRNGADYAGFHLLAGDAGKTIAYVTPDDYRLLEPGVHALSNAPLGEHWRKEEIAAGVLLNAVESIEESDKLAAELLRFLRTPRGAGRVEEEIFIEGERYGTRASTVVIATMNGISFFEQNYGAIRRFSCTT